jgi:truncated hemoglobin YjbI
LRCIYLIINAMTAATLKKYRTYLTDDAGKPVMVQLDLRNKMLKNAYEEWMEDLEDTMNAMQRDNDEVVDFETVKTRILSTQKLA